MRLDTIEDGNRTIDSAIQHGQLKANEAAQAAIRHVAGELNTVNPTLFMLHQAMTGENKLQVLVTMKYRDPRQLPLPGDAVEQRAVIGTIRRTVVLVLHGQVTYRIKAPGERTCSLLTWQRWCAGGEVVAVHAD